MKFLRVGENSPKQKPKWDSVGSKVKKRLPLYTLQLFPKKKGTIRVEREKIVISTVSLDFSTFGDEDNGIAALLLSLKPNLTMWEGT